ncbi:MAG: class I SAM-dependent methyltransferase [Pseudomonadota bacterium]
MTSPGDQVYSGVRILEAMRSGTRYGEAVFNDILRAMPQGASSILDFGAGSGFFAEKFDAAGMKVDAVEQDASLRDALVPLAHRLWSDIDDVPDDHFDFAYTVNVLEHIEELDVTCAQLLRKLKPGARLFVFVPAHEILWTSLDTEVGHVRRFDRASLRKALQHAGFEVEQLRHFDFLGFPATLGVRLLEKLNLFSYSSGSVGFYDSYLFPVSHVLDRLFGGVIGKNLAAVATRPVGPSSRS